MNNYTVKINETSRKLSAIERIAVKDTTHVVQLDEVTSEAPLVICPDFWATLDVHNEKSENQDYKKLVIVDKSGTHFITGSESFTRTFFSIYEEISEAIESGEEVGAWAIECYKMPSKNYKGKEFLACAITDATNYDEPKEVTDHAEVEPVPVD